MPLGASFCKNDRALPFAKVVGHILKKVAGPGGIFVEGVEVQRELFPPRELKFGGRYVRQVPNIRIFENSKIVQHRAKPNIQIFRVPIPSTLADGQPTLEF
ncbi:hypothetical protein L3X38_033185 [Prunus dulcis]|uniref:Uncharacterized protein n=1 Tax=Prunus dulcis TaxID=3755 RepID=A0AAD4YVN4_PRUDU|nr:hypothetical protein L3X38_033185 [Prunus dulcis]